ncbi:MAG: bifunctional nicotinamide-nucleotide adenylyltransferase/Nudix hydroxylase [Azoarcus sp.]|jgi:bifunctional NMN adenylyltransferase/nudix hydrolase|nr:bifunctional nicotinamide-nucleotide adenylyltransferase/Nudix hydroxylase [Azoarcus sp.]
MNTDRQYDAAILIGRFQPFHNGHAALLEKALEIGGRALVALGSSFRARDARNPFTWEERAAMIRTSLGEAEARRVTFIPVRDYYDDRRWAAAVEEGARAALEQAGLAAPRVALAGFRKDASSDYLGLFPHWPFVALERQGNIDATAIRRMYFGDAGTQTTCAAWQSLVPPATVRYLEDWAALPVFSAMREEHRAVAAYRQKWGKGPFVTLDAVVTAAGHVLLVRRKRAPGKGLWALPGGFLEGRERLLQGAIRELKEETGLDLAAAASGGAPRAVAVFDHPDRSARGRIITHAHWFDLPLATLPAVAGADDAAEARWFPVAGLPGMEAELFEDHFPILGYFLAPSSPP